MSDSFIAIFGTGLLTGVALTLIILLLTGGRNERNNDTDLDMRTYIPSWDRDRSSDHRHYNHMAGGSVKTPGK